MSMDLVTAYVRDPEHALEPYPPTDGGRGHALAFSCIALVRTFFSSKTVLVLWKFSHLVPDVNHLLNSI